MRDGVLAGVHDRELVVVAGVAADRRVDGADERVGQALHERVVGLVDRALLEGPLEHRVGALALGADHHQARGADVEPVHDALALAGPARSRCGSRRRPRPPSTFGPVQPDARVRGDADRLVDDDDVVVVVDDGHAGHRLGDDLEGRAAGRCRAAAPRACRRRRPGRPCRRWRRRRSRRRRRRGRRPWCGTGRTAGRGRRRRARPRGRPGTRHACGRQRVHPACSGSAPRPGPSRAMPRKASTMMMHGSRTTIAMSATLTMNSAEVVDEVDDVTPAGPGRAEHPVGEVAQGAAEQQAEGQGPRHAAQPCGRPMTTQTRMATDDGVSIQVSPCRSRTPPRGCGSGSACIIDPTA